MKAEDVDAALVEKAARAAYYADPFYRSVFGKKDRGANDVTCCECGGRGSFLVDDGARSDREDCERCDGTGEIEEVARVKRRLRECAENWPEAETGEYNPACCRFPKSCSASVYSEERVTDGELEPQIATQEPAGATQGGSGDAGTWGGLDGAPDAVLESTPDLSVFTESTLLHDIARLEQERDGARIKGAQWKARYEEMRDELRFTADRANSSEASYRQLMLERERVQGLAQWFRDQGQVGYARKVEEAAAGTVPEPTTENPFRMPEDRA